MELTADKLLSAVRALSRRRGRKGNLELIEIWAAMKVPGDPVETIPAVNRMLLDLEHDGKLRCDRHRIGIFGWSLR